MKKQVVGSMTEWSGVLKEVVRQMCDGELTREQCQLFVEHKNPFSEQPTDDLIDWVVVWQNFYKEVFDLEVVLSGIVIPKKKKGFDRLLVLVPRMTPQRLFDKCKELFGAGKWTDWNLDEVFLSERGGAYAVWVRDRVEPDVELKNRSANGLKRKSISGITLEERFIYELKYFKETGKHLDISNRTLCPGSSSSQSEGGVPDVGWRGRDDRLDVNWCRPNHVYDDIRAREVVS